MIEQRVEMRKKIEERRREVQEALTAAEASQAAPERLNGLRTELRVVDEAVSGGWENMAEATAADLMRWMTQTAPLVTDVSRAVTLRPST